MKERNISIDILKFIAVFFIINSHADICYPPKYQMLATGGAIGNALFLFCSGFTVFMGQMDRFDNWYKKRINRIYPSVLAFLFFNSLFFGETYSAGSLFFRSGWFIYCIMIYYIFLYLIKRYMSDRLNLAFALSCIPVLIYYFFEDRNIVFMYKVQSFDFPKIFYFLFMLFGAMIGISKRKFKFRLLYDSLKLAGSIFIYYVFLFIASKYQIIAQLQILSLLPLFAITFYFYKLCNAQELISIVQSPIIKWIVYIVSMLTLEIYLVQFGIFTDKMNTLFPLNLFILIIIIIIAYIVKVSSRIFSQTFNENKYNWENVFKL